MISSERATHGDTDGPLSIGDIDSSISSMDGISPQRCEELKDKSETRDKMCGMDKHVCDHLRAVEDYLVSVGRAITGSGQAWSSNCRFWVYFDAVLDCEALIKKFALAGCIGIHQNDDPHSG